MNPQLHTFCEQLLLAQRTLLSPLRMALRHDRHALAERAPPGMLAPVLLAAQRRGQRRRARVRRRRGGRVRGAVLRARVVAMAMQPRGDAHPGAKAHPARRAWGLLVRVRRIELVIVELGAHAHNERGDVFRGGLRARAAADGDIRLTLQVKRIAWGRRDDSGIHCASLSVRAA